MQRTVTMTFRAFWAVTLTLLLSLAHPAAIACADEPENPSTASESSTTSTGQTQLAPEENPQQAPDINSSASSNADETVANETDTPNNSDSNAEEDGSTAVDNDGGNNESGNNSDVDIYTGPTGLVKDAKGYRYIKKDGTLVTNSFKTIKGKTYYFNKKGRSVRYGQRINGKLYYFRSDYTRYTGWVTWKADGRKSYFSANKEGAAASGWWTISGKKYYFDRNNKAVRYKQQIGNKTYYFNAKGHLYTGWVTWKADGRKSYFSPNKGGAAASGWWTISGKRYYFLPSSKKTARYSQSIKGKQYYFRKDGTVYTGWLQWKADKRWSYFGKNGVSYTGVKSIYGVSYNFGTKGKITNSQYRKSKVLGVPRNELIKWLKSKEKNRYYLGTRFSTGLSLSTCLYPKGAPRSDGFVGMNCGGFVAHAYQKSGGSTRRIGLTQSHSPWGLGPGRGHYVNAWRWYGYAIDTGAKIYTYKNVQALLASGKAQKGDLIFFKTDGTRDCHIGFFWGDTPKENKFWHSDSGGNRISTCVNRGNPSGYNQRVVLIKG